MIAQHARADLSMLGHRLAWGRLHRLGIGAIDLDQRQVVSAPPPDRQRQAIENSAQAVALAPRCVALGGELAGASGLQEPHDIRHGRSIRAAGAATDHVEPRTGRQRGGQCKGRPFVAQPRNRRLDRGRIWRREAQQHTSESPGAARERLDRSRLEILGAV